MKKWFEKHGALLAAMALVITTMTANATCVFCVHQPKMPEGAKKLRKF